MRVVSLIPSLTETLIHCGVEVVGRTRFCIHPRERVQDIRAVGGTKDVRWDRCQDLSPHLVLLDREENTREMADSCPYPSFVIHIQSIHDVGPELTRLAGELRNEALAQLGRRWMRVVSSPPPPRTLEKLPGVIEWWRTPTDRQQQFLYLIWKDPWMAIGEPTFIQSMLDFLGYADSRIALPDAYATIDLATYDPEQTTLLCSSEPFAFARQKKTMLELGYALALVDGELFSWYGIRGLEFLEPIVNADL